METIPTWIWVGRGGQQHSGVLTFVVPAGFLRVGAASKSMRDILSDPSGRAFARRMASLRREDWVFIDDLTGREDLRPCVGKSYNGRYGQVLDGIATPAGNPSAPMRCAVAVDDMPGKFVQTCFGGPRQQSFKVVSLPMRSLCRVQPTVCAVRLWARGERGSQGPDAVGLIQDRLGDQRRDRDPYASAVSERSPHYCSEVRLPAGLPRFAGGGGDSDLMRRAGLPLALREVEPVCDLCHIDRLNDRALEANCIIASELRDNAPQWEGVAGPHVVSRVDGKDLSVSDFTVVWAFHWMDRFESSSLRNSSLRLGITPAAFEDFEARYLAARMSEAAAAEVRARAQDLEAASLAAQAGVIEPVVHATSAAAIDPGEASEVARESWAGSVERLAGAGAPLLPQAAARGVLVFKFSRPSPELDEALLQSAPARAAAARGVDVQPAWANGAKIFVDEVDEPGVLDPQVLGNSGEFVPSHVVIYEEEEEGLHSALRGLPYKTRKLKPDILGRRACPRGPSMMNVSAAGSAGAGSAGSTAGSASSAGFTSQVASPQEPQASDPLECIEYEVRRTFIHIAPGLDDLDTRTCRTA